MTRAGEELHGLLRAELSQAVAPQAKALAAAIVAEHGDAVAAILFYGSCLRDATDGILDFYVLVDAYRPYHGRRLASAMNRLVPPTVSLWTLGTGAGAIRAKVAVISRAQFARRMRADSLDITLWARFCQPAALVHARDPAMAAWVARVLADAVCTAALWAVRLGPDQGSAEAYWLALFRRTYRAELRPETRDDRARTIHAVAADRYDRVLTPALACAGVTVERLPDGQLRPHRIGREAAWWPRLVAGKMLTVVRLAKASFTFVNGVDYILWKIERHSGHRVELAPWQRAHPLLAAPLVLWRLWRRGAVR